MKKVGVGVILLLILSVVQVLTVTAQECADPCEDNTWCAPDQQCTNGCCEPIPCTTDIDCPFPCVSPSGFAPQFCNTCVEGICKDPCDCDYGEDCPGPPDGSGPCTNDATPKCIDNNCEQCATDCDCADVTEPLNSDNCDVDADCGNNPFVRCSPDLCFRKTGGNPGNPRPDCDGENNCIAGTFTCAATECSFNSQCDDENICTDDVCGDDGTCSNPNNSAPCASDSDECTDDICSGGSCTHPDNIAQCSGDCAQCVSGTCTQDCTNDFDGDGYLSCLV